MIYLGDHVRARVALPGNDDFTVKRPIDEAHRLPAIGAAGRARVGARALPGVRAGRCRHYNVIERRMQCKPSHGSSVRWRCAPRRLRGAGERARPDGRLVGRRLPGRAARSLLQAVHETTGVKLAEESWDGGVGTLRAKIQGGNNNWDVVQVESDELLLGCEEGLYEKLDWAKLGGKDKYMPDAVNDCGVGAIVYSFILAYDGDKIKGDAPKTWADFWNAQKWPGKRALRKGPKTTLEIALMADGVAPKDVYKTLGTDAGVERAFKKLDQLKANSCGGRRARSRRSCSRRAKSR